MFITHYGYADDGLDGYKPQNSRFSASAFVKEA